MGSLGELDQARLVALKASYSSDRLFTLPVTSCDSTYLTKLFKLLSVYVSASTCQHHTCPCCTDVCLLLSDEAIRVAVGLCLVLSMSASHLSVLCRRLSPPIQRSYPSCCRSTSRTQHMSASHLSVLCRRWREGYTVFHVKKVAARQHAITKTMTLYGEHCNVLISCHEGTHGSSK